MAESNFGGDDQTVELTHVQQCEMVRCYCQTAAAVITTAKALQ